MILSVLCAPDAHGVFDSTAQNLAVREEGDFFLRYRTFNTVYPVTGDNPLPVLAECVGGPFTIYPTNAFPGLSPSTALTKVSVTSPLPPPPPLLSPGSTAPTS